MTPIRLLTEQREGLETMLADGLRWLARHPLSHDVPIGEAKEAVPTEEFLRAVADFIERLP